MSKITFVTPSAYKRTPGIRPRCTHRHRETRQHCLKPQGHTQNHSYKDSPVHAAEKAAPKKNFVVSKETKLDCLQMIEDPVYRKRLLADLRERKLRPAVECMLWYYAKGKPKEMVEHSGTLTLQQELSALSNEELQARALEVAAMLKGETVH